MLSGWLAEGVSVVLLVVVLVCAVVRPWGWPEAVVAVPAAGVAVLTGAIGVAHSWDEAVRLAPVVWFLAAVLALAQLCADEGLFGPAGPGWGGGRRGGRSGCWAGCSGSRR